MDFPICGQHFSPYVLVSIGFVVGVLGGFFGVGGSFLAGPALLALGMPGNFVVGTDIAHIVGKSVVAAKTHRALGNVDLKLGLVMTAGTILGVEIGAQVIQVLKRHGRAQVDFAVSMAFLTVLVCISSFMAWESWQTLRRRGRQRPDEGKGERNAADSTAAAGSAPTPDESAFSHWATRVQRVHLPPMISLPQSGIASISLWMVLLVAVAGGFLSGFLGAGGGFMRMPAMVYFLGVPTHIAVGTDLFEIVVSASYGTLTHALKGNVDILVALVMHTGAAIGAQIGAIGTQFIGGPKIRLAFVPLPLIGAALLIYNLLTGHKGH